MTLNIDNFVRVKYLLILMRLMIIMDVVIDFTYTKDKRYQDLLVEFDEYDSPLMQNLYLGNAILSITLLVFFSVEIIRVVVDERFGSLLVLSLVSIQVDIVWHFINLGVDLWPISITGLFLSFAFNFLALIFAHMIYHKKSKTKYFNFNKISI